MTARVKQREGRSRFFSNTVALVLQTILATVITLVQVKILSNFLDQGTFGLFASLRGFSLLLAMLAANGVPQLLMRFIPEHEADGDTRRAARLSAVSMLCSTTLLALLGVLVYALRHRLFAFAGDILTAEGLWFWFSATTVGVMLKLVLYGGLNGLRRLTVQVVLETVSLAAALLWIVLERDHLSLLLLFKILGAVNLVTVGVGIPVLFVEMRRVSPGRPPHRPGAGRGGYGAYLTWAAALSFVALAFTDVDRYLLAQVLSLELLAMFHIGARIGRLANRLLAVPNLAFQPEVTRLNAEGRASGIVFATRLFMKFNSVLAVLTALCLALFARELVVAVASNAYLGAVPLLVILALSLPLTTMTAPVTTVMKALDQVRGALLADLAWALSYVVLLLVLGRAFGLVGVGVAHLAACLAQLALALRISRLSIDVAFTRRVLVRLLLGAAAFSPVLIVDLITGDLALAESLALKIPVFLGGCIVFQRVLRAMGFFAEDEKQALFELLRARGLGWAARLM